MILERGDMWSVFGKTDLFLITTNPIINKQGLAVMGRGIAKEASDRFPSIRRDFASHMQNLRATDTWPSYCDLIGRYDNQDVGFFMVKNHWSEPADLDVIRRSVNELYDWDVDCEFRRVDLNFPGIGNGRLSRKQVLPIIEKLPDSVHVWEYA